MYMYMYMYIYIYICAPTPTPTPTPIHTHTHTHTQVHCNTESGYTKALVCPRQHRLLHWCWRFCATRSTQAPGACAPHRSPTLLPAAATYKYVSDPGNTTAHAPSALEYTDCCTGGFMRRVGRRQKCVRVAQECPSLLHATHAKKAESLISADDGTGWSRMHAHVVRGCSDTHQVWHRSSQSLCVQMAARSVALSLHTQR